RPTPAARLLESYARQAVGLLRAAERAAADLQELRSGALTVGASTTPGTYLLPAALGRFHVTHPALALSLQISDTREIERGVAVVSRHAVLARDRRIVAARLAGPRWTRDLLIVRRLGTPLGPAAAAFRDLLLAFRA